MEKWRGKIFVCSGVIRDELPTRKYFAKYVVGIFTGCDNEFFSPLYNLSNQKLRRVTANTSLLLTVNVCIRQFIHGLMDHETFKSCNVGCHGDGVLGTT
jgi:hypothetical protein